MNIFYENSFIKNNEVLFYSFVIIFILIILVTIFIGIKENKK